ncbi:molybdenum cofactor guanylyltransferase [Aneurinibacillus tyrosinisolvens]|uniref:molybdenum cofactor guanylyltransferase n=1 Tax=Aneurinibacillus tyrosinisolvens TaxID=1443435 RepID=UPI00063F82FF|nr:molybdenum cofactor guanylyltransferase [Aneurinibacillus tyrosinisolvens]
MQGVILAGGKSKRMGKPKEMLELSGQTLLERTCLLLLETVGNCLVVSNNDEHSKILPDIVPVYPDKFPEQGPLGGIGTAMAHSPHQRLFIVACDMPLLTQETIAYITEQSEKADPEFDVVLPSWGGRQHPLCAIYHRRLYPVIEQLLLGGDRRIFHLLQDVKVKNIDLTPIAAYDVFYNMNTPEEYEHVRKEG